MARIWIVADDALTPYPFAPAQVEAALTDGLAGSLSRSGLPSLLTMLSLDRRTGELDVVADGERARLSLRDGQVVVARFLRRDAPRGAECVYALMRCASGHFAFVDVPVKVRDEVQTSTTALLMEGARRADEESVRARVA
jgi:hypothetical protein